MQLRINAPIEPLTPEKFASYLENKGWRKNQQWFVNKNESLPVVQFHKMRPKIDLPWEINLPMTTKIADYESCVYWAIQYLSHTVENRSEYEIYQDIVGE